METSISQNPSQLSLPPPPQQNPYEYFRGCTVTIISRFEIRYQGAFCDLNLQNSTLLLVNVICYGTEGRREDGIQIPPLNQVYDYIIFRTNEIKIVDHNPFLMYSASLSKGFKPSNAAKPPRPPSGSKRRKKVPLLTCENLENSQATTTSESYASLVNDTRLQIASSNPYEPQFPAFKYLNPPCSYGFVPSQAPMSHVSSSYFQYPYAYEPIYPRSLFTTFPPIPVSIPPEDKGSCEFESMRNMKQYNLWSFEEEDRPIERPCNNPFGPIARPVKVKEVDNTKSNQEVTIES